MSNLPTSRRAGGVLRPLLFSCLFGLLLLLVLGEVYLQFVRVPKIKRVPAPTTIDPYAPNSYVLGRRPYVYFLRPGTRYTQEHEEYRVEYSVNRLGFRGPDPALPSPGKRRLLVIGDSFVEGHGVEYPETFPHHLDEALAADGWEVRGAGVQGASPMYYAASWERYRRYAPAAILVLLFDNDLFEDRSREAGWQRLPVLEDRQALLRCPGEGPGLRLPGVLTSALSKRWPPPPQTPGEEAMVAVAAGRKPLRDLPPGSPPGLVHPEDVPQEWDATRRYLERLRDLAAAEGVPMMVASLSLKNREAETPELQRRYSEAFQAAVKAWGPNAKVPVFVSIDRVDDYLAAGNEPRISYAVDGHFPAYGHRWFAEQLAPWLREKLPAAGEASNLAVPGCP